MKRLILIAFALIFIQCSDNDFRTNNWPLHEGKKLFGYTVYRSAGVGGKNMTHITNVYYKNNMLVLYIVRPEGDAARMENFELVIINEQNGKIALSQKYPYDEPSYNGENWENTGSIFLNDTLHPPFSIFIYDAYTAPSKHEFRIE